MFRKVSAALAFLSLVFGAVPVGSQTSPSEDIAGLYYFKGIGILEIRPEGDHVVAEMAGERKLWDVLFAEGDTSDAQKALGRRMAQIRHRGTRTGPLAIDFGAFDITYENILRRFGIAEADLLPEIKSGLQERLGGKNLGNYFERWNLLPGGRLEIDAAVPIFSYALFFAPSVQEEQPKIQSFSSTIREMIAAPAGPARDLFGEFRAQNPQLCKRVCGWKITHVGEIEGWRALEARQYPQAADFFRKAAEAQPDSPFPYFGEAWARIGTQEFEVARHALQGASGRLTPEMRPFLEEVVFLIQDQIYSYETLAMGPNSDYVTLAESFESRWPPETRKQEVIQQLYAKKARAIAPEEYDRIREAVAAFPLWQDLKNAVSMRGRATLLPLGPSAFTLDGYRALSVSNTLTYRNLAAMAVFSGHLWRGQVKIQEAVFQYATAVRLGQIVRHGSLISHMIGIAMEQMGVNALLDLFEDGFVKDPDIVRRLSATVAYLEENEPHPELGELWAYEASLGIVMADQTLEFIFSVLLPSPNYSEALTRQKVLEARFAILHGLCVLKQQALAAPFPAKLDPALLPADPFAPAEKIRYIYRDGDETATLYSIGPDGRDQGTTLRYDPTNGASSAGDIYLRTR